jgi:chromosome partitioning protein
VLLFNFKYPPPNNRSMLTRSIAVSNGKGGAGKTSVASHLAGVAAAAGWKVLAIDLDAQGNLGQDLGYHQAGHSDDGKGLADAFINGTRLVPLVNVRPNLDVIPAGEHTERLHDELVNWSLVDPMAITSLERTLAPLAMGYQLIVFDCPPGGRLLLESALAASHFVLSPTQADDGSLMGLIRVARRLATVRQTTNPALELLGVALFNVGSNDRRIIAEVRQQLGEALDGIAPVFDPFIRNARKASRDMRASGRLAFEYEEAAANATPWFGSLAGTAETFAGNAEGLASDYVRLCTDVLQHFQARLIATQPATSAP